MRICREVREIRRPSVSLLFVAFLIIAGCVPENNKKPQSGRIIRDKHGNEVTFSGKALKVMGLSPAITEMLFALLPDSNIAAVTPHCNFPAEGVDQKPVVQVMPLDFEAILKIRPSLVLTEEGITSATDFNRLRELGIPVLMFTYRNISDITDAMDSIRIWTNAGENAAHVCDSLRKQLNELQRTSSEKPDAGRPGLLALTWTDPIFAYGAETWMSEKMWLAGGKNALQQKLGKPYPQLEREQVLALNPDVIFGGSFEKMDSSFFRIYPELKRLTAYKNRKIFPLNDDLASRPGPRFLEGIQEISNLINQ